MERRLRRPSPAMIVACLALGVSLSGIGYAATVLPRNSVGTAQLQANAVVSGKVRNGTLMRADFKTGQVPAGPQGAKGDTGVKGDKGDNGDKGDKGEPGPAGRPGISGFNARSMSNGPSTARFITATAECSPPTRILGGGFHLVSNTGQIPQLNQSSPNQTRTAWVVRTSNLSRINATVISYAICGLVP